MKPDSDASVTLVTGLPRSGTSLLMQMLRAGGMPVRVDDVRPADGDNPRGYLEFSPVLASARDNRWVPSARGHAVKIVYRLVSALPRAESYRLLLLRRDLGEVLASQRAMLERSGKPLDPAQEAPLERTFAAQLAEFIAWAHVQGLPLLEVPHRDLLGAPRESAGRVARFLGRDLDLDAMAACVEPGLYRQRVVSADG